MAFILDADEPDVLEVFGDLLHLKNQTGDLTKVIFVGSNPSRASDTPSIPFLETRSGDVLRSWVKLLGVHCYRFVNVSDRVTEGNRPLRKREVLYDTLARQLQGDFFIIALGNTAASALTRVGRSHFKLPHPSPKNRRLNDRRGVLEALRDCRRWLERQKAPSLSD